MEWQERGARGQRGEGGMRERRRTGSAQEGFQLRCLHSDLIWPVCLGYESLLPLGPPAVVTTFYHRLRGRVLLRVLPAPSTNTHNVNVQVKQGGGLAY